MRLILCIAALALMATTASAENVDLSIVTVKTDLAIVEHSFAVVPETLSTDAWLQRYAPIAESRKPKLLQLDGKQKPQIN